jgi:hypothetical protein
MIWSWFKKRLVLRSNVECPVKAAVDRPARHDMTLDRWQKDDGLVNWARTSHEFADALAVVSSLKPTGYPVRGGAVTEIQCAVELGRHEGYADCCSVLLALRQFPLKATDEIPADYDNTEYPAEG